MKHLIFINGETVAVEREDLSYDEISRLAGIDPERRPSIVYRLPEAKGVLSRGGSVRIGTASFTVAVTGDA